MSFPRYESYKDSGVEWLGEVPGHWEVLALKHIVSTPITDGPHETPNFPDEGVPFVSAEAVASGKIDFSKIRGFISMTDHLRYSQKYRPQIGDIYMVKSGATTGVTAIVETTIDFNIWSPLAAIRCSTVARPWFVLNFLRSKNFQEAVALNWSFGTQQNIGMGVIENLAVTIPPIEEQSTIAAFLDFETAQIDALIAEQQKLIALLKEKRQAVISHAVTNGLDPTVPMKDSGIEWLGKVPEHWEIAAIGKKIQLQRGVDITKDNQIDEGIPVVSSGGISSFHNTYICEGPGIVVGRKGTAGKVHYVESNYWPHDTTLYVKEFGNNNPKYVYYKLISMELETYDTGSANPTLNRNVVHPVKLPWPSVEEQCTIATFLDRETAKIDELITEAQRGIELLKERRSALISAAVTGKIDVRGWTPPEAV